MTLFVGQAYAQAPSESKYPFSWAGATTYSVAVGVDAMSSVQHFDELSGHLNGASFEEYGVEVLSIAVTPIAAQTASAATEPGSVVAPCALAAQEIDSRTGGIAGLSNVVRDAHSKDMRVVLSIDGGEWCGAADAEAYNALRSQAALDGLIVSSVDKMSTSDIAVLRQMDTEETGLWIGLVFDDVNQIDSFEGSTWIDAAQNKSWLLPSQDDPVELKSQFARSVAFAVDHPDMSNIGMIQTTTPLSTKEVTTLLLQPGTITIQDGQIGSDPATTDHWKIMGAFRDRHPAIGAGAHEDISDGPYMFYRGLRVGPDVDEVLVVLGASGNMRLNVSVVFEDDTVIRDAYTGKIALVSYGQVRLAAHENGVMLLEEVK
jgi:hypothetical protein